MECVDVPFLYVCPFCHCSLSEGDEVMWWSWLVFLWWFVTLSIFLMNPMAVCTSSLGLMPAFQSDCICLCFAIEWYWFLKYLDIKPSSELWFVNITSHFIGLNSCLLKVSASALGGSFLAPCKFGQMLLPLLTCLWAIIFHFANMAYHIQWLASAKHPCIPAAHFKGSCVCFYFMCLSVCLHVWDAVCHRRSKRTSDPLEL